MFSPFAMHPAGVLIQPHPQCRCNSSDATATGTATGQQHLLRRPHNPSSLPAHEPVRSCTVTAAVITAPQSEARRPSARASHCLLQRPAIAETAEPCVELGSQSWTPGAAPHAPVLMWASACCSASRRRSIAARTSALAAGAADTGCARSRMATCPSTCDVQVTKWKILHIITPRPASSCRTCSHYKPTQQDTVCFP